MSLLFDDGLQYQRVARTHQIDSNSSEQLSTTTPASKTTGIASSRTQAAGQDGPTTPVLPGTPAEPAGMAGPNSDGKAQNFIVFLESAPGAGGLEQRMRALMGSLGIAGNPVMVFDQLNGFVLNISEQQAQRLRALGGVQSVEADAAVFLEPPVAVEPYAVDPSSLASLANGKTGTALSNLAVFADGMGQSSDIVPWGVQAVWRGDDITQRGNIASDTFAFVIDSGILNSTGDLNFASNTWHRSWVSGEGAFTDGNGHGTHVAGTIGALVNGTGVVGVAPGANMISLKVFDSSGGGASFATIIDAVNHAVNVINANGLDKRKAVINMSLGGSFSSSLDSAIKNAASQGILFALAAGNSGADVDGFSPAAAGGERNPNVFTVSAVDSNYRMTSWSNWDRLDRRDREDNVDVAAPGASVLSYYRNGQLAYLNGTSMAAPHVAGLLLMGGVEQGDLVTPYYRDTADPFAWGISNPSAPEPEPEPETPIDESNPITDADQVLWGTTGNDIITGGSGNDRISGVLATGTSAEAMGAGQIDTLTGGAGADIFVLGDSRGVFYDNRNSRNTGTGDYALIKDFTPGEDKLQLAGGSYLGAVSNGSLSLYWDRNGNGKLDTGGRNQDELIAVLEGVSGLSSGDILWA
jgi:Ca2+-binding RTX toxin-like protein